MADDLQNIGAQLFAQGVMGAGGGAGGGKVLLGILPDIECKALGIQGVSFGDKPICQSSVFAAFANNTAGSKGPSFISKLAASMREDFTKMKQAGDQLLAQGAQSSAIQPGERIGNGLGSVGLSTDGPILS